MTESATHSPTPWSVSEAAFWRIYDAAGAEVVNAEGVVDAELSDRIVHAVNLHDEMVEALKAALPIIGRYESEHESNEALTVHAMITAALSKSTPPQGA